MCDRSGGDGRGRAIRRFAQGGVSDIAFATYPSVIAHVKSGRLALLAVSNVRRSKLLPEVPTIAEGGVPGFGVDNWQGLFGPPGLSRKIQIVLDKEAAEIVRSKEFSDVANTQGAEADHIGLGEFTAFVRKDHARWKQIIDKHQIRGD